MANKLVIAPAPHVQSTRSTASIMRDVVIALLPGIGRLDLRVPDGTCLR